jgi:hypothetical protein
MTATSGKRGAEQTPQHHHNNNDETIGNQNSIGEVYHIVDYRTR